MNKAQRVDGVTARIGERRTAAAGVDGVLDTVGAGESVAIIGFGEFEGRARAAQTARNPRTCGSGSAGHDRAGVPRGAGFRAAVRADAALRGVPFERVAVAGGNGAAKNGAGEKGAGTVTPLRCAI
jgi:DNA-binding protein HU-beta